MDSAVIRDMVLGVVRHLAAAAGASLVTEGVLTQSQTNDFIGAVLFFAGLALSMYDKYRRGAVKGA